MNYNELSSGDILDEIAQLKEKFIKLRNLAQKVAKEMDALSDTYNALKQELDNRQGNN